MDVFNRVDSWSSLDKLFRICIKINQLGVSMNKRIEQTLQSALIDLIETATTAKDFIIAETPDVVNQLLIWEATKSGLSMTFSILFIVVFFIAWKKIIQIEKGIEENNSSFMYAFYGFGGIISIIYIPITINMVSLDWLKILIAPKLYIIEYAAELTK